MEHTNKEKAMLLLKSIETGAVEPSGYINPDRYIQHNLSVGDGVDGFRQVLAQLSSCSPKVNTVRAFVDGSYVFAHSEYELFGPKTGFDIFRFEEGLIVEHWDNLQAKPDGLNPGGRSMIDGETGIRDLERTESNKRLVSHFVDEVLVKGNLDRLAGYFDGDRYLQHNPSIADGLSGLGAALNDWAAQGITMQYHTIHKVLGEGNFVLVVSEGLLGGILTSFYDLFRVENGYIAEHWDVIESIPPKEAWKNNNGKF